MTVTGPSRIPYRGREKWVSLKIRGVMGTPKFQIWSPWGHQKSWFSQYRLTFIGVDDFCEVCFSEITESNFLLCRPTILVTFGWRSASRNEKKSKFRGLRWKKVKRRFRVFRKVNDMHIYNFSYFLRILKTQCNSNEISTFLIKLIHIVTPLLAELLVCWLFQFSDSERH